MKELFRSLRLSKLSNTPLSAEIKVLDDAINFIQDILDKIEIKTDEDMYPDSEFYFINGKAYFEYNSKNTYLWCRYDEFWEVLVSKYQYNTQEIKEIVKDVVEEHFNRKEVTPLLSHHLNKQRVEEHFNRKEVTPAIFISLNITEVEGYFKK